MATERQIEANRRNAARSSGPKSASGKIRSRANATKHGLAGELPELEIELSPEFVHRRQKWFAGVTPADPAMGWAMDKAVAASLRVDRCERTFDQVILASRERANSTWPEDREAEAGLLFDRLARDPVSVSRQLRISLAGVELLIEAWLGLAASLEETSLWSESEESLALDLLGVSPDLRQGRTAIDPIEKTDPVAFRRGLAVEEVERLEALRDDALVPLDEMDRQRALVGDIAMLSKPARLVLRYERDAWRRYDKAMAEVRGEAVAVGPATPRVKLEGVSTGDRPEPNPLPDVPGAEVRPSSASPSTAERRPSPRKRPARRKARKPIQIKARPTSLVPHFDPLPAKPAARDKAGVREGVRPVGPAKIAPSEPTFEEQRRALQAEAKRFLKPNFDKLRSMGFDDEDAMLEELERRVALGPAGYRVTERTQSCEGPTDRGLARGAGG